MSILNLTLEKQQFKMFFFGMVAIQNVPASQFKILKRKKHVMEKENLWKPEKTCHTLELPSFMSRMILL